MIDLFLDTETTGLQAMLKGTETPGKHDIIQVAGIWQDDSKFEFKCQPHRWDSIAQQALDVHGYQINDLKGFPLPGIVCGLVRAELLDRRMKFGTSNERFRLIAHNMPFDYKFLKAWWLKCGYADWDNWFVCQEDCLCTKKLGNDAKKKGLLPGIQNMKLITIAAYFGIRFDAHDALGDTIACKGVYENLLGLLNGEVQPGGPSDEDLISEGKVPMDQVELNEPVTATGSMEL